MTSSLSNFLLDLKSKLNVIDNMISDNKSEKQTDILHNSSVKKFSHIEEKLDEIGKQDEVRILNVGGKKFITKLSNLKFFKKSLFAKLVKEEPNKKEFFFDRTKKNFKIILNFLRNKLVDLKSLDPEIKFELQDEMIYYGLMEKDDFKDKIEYDIEWDPLLSKKGACTINKNDPKVLNIHSTTCKTVFVTNKVWTNEKFKIEFDSNVHQEDEHYYIGLVNETYKSGCMCGCPEGAFYINCEGEVNDGDRSFILQGFSFLDKHCTIGMRVNLMAKTIYYYIKDKIEVGPLMLSGDTFRVVSGHCNDGSGTLTILSCTED